MPGFSQGKRARLNLACVGCSFATAGRHTMVLRKIDVKFEVGACLSTTMVERARRERVRDASFAISCFIFGCVGPMDICTREDCSADVSRL